MPPNITKNIHPSTPRAASPTKRGLVKRPIPQTSPKWRCRACLISSGTKAADMGL